MAAPFYRWVFGDLRTGKQSRTVDLTDFSFSVPFNGPGTIEGSFPLKSGEWPTADVDSTPGKQFLAVAYVDEFGIETFIEGGPVWTRRHTNSTGVLTIGAAGLATYFDHRKLIPVLTAGQNPAEASVTYNAAQLGLIAKRLVELSQSHTAGSLPIVLPDDADFSGGDTDKTRTYPGYELAWIGERLKQLSEVEGGPEVQFVPRRKTSDPRYIEWVMRVGVEANSMQLTQAGPPWVFDAGVVKSDVREIEISADGAGVAQRQWAAGQGEAEGRPIVYDTDSALLDFGWPLLEGEVTALDTVSETSTLNAHVAEALLVSARPIETWTVTVSRDGRPNVGKFRTGDWATLRLRGHSLKADGDYSMRILNVAGNTTGSVSLSMSARLGEV